MSTGFITVFVLTKGCRYDIIIKKGWKILFLNGISKKYIKKALSDSAYDIEVKRSVSSTNTLMKERAHNSAKEFSVLIASMQTGGRGRMGRTFHSPHGTGIYMSILLKNREGRSPLLITTDAAVCVARVLEKMSKEKAEIKWVNDIYMRGKKVCGILTEGVGEYAVVGIGINVLPPKKGFPKDIKDIAGAVFERKKPYLREKVIIKLLREFMNVYEKPEREKILSEYKERSMVLGKEIFILKNGNSEPATAVDITDDYSLVVKKENGEISYLNSGDVSIKI